LHTRTSGIKLESLIADIMDKYKVCRSYVCNARKQYKKSNEETENYLIEELNKLPLHVRANLTGDSPIAKYQALQRSMDPEAFFRNRTIQTARHRELLRYSKGQRVIARKRLSNGTLTTIPRKSTVYKKAWTRFLLSVRVCPLNSSSCPFPWYRNDAMHTKSALPYPGKGEDRAITGPAIATCRKVFPENAPPTGPPAGVLSGYLSPTELALVARVTRTEGTVCSA
jgi:hypothetical protein